jgi:tyrosinase
MASAPPRVRKDVYKLGSGDRTLEWYGRAIAEMKKRPLKDPTSLRYQSAIHGYNRDRDPLKKKGETQPSSADQAKYWNKCQHSTWHFLSWHRGFLLYFERICGAAIVKLGGPKDWGLPYWNYSDTTNPNAAKVPPAFLPSKTGGKDNPLFAPGRERGTPGFPPINPAEVSLKCLKRARFIGADDGGSPGWGGPETGFSHLGGWAYGACEKTPHGDIHMAVGGKGGWILDPESAGLDPLFWLHHCNIDRLWEVWRGRQPNTGEPTSSAWLDFPFDAHDEKGAPVTYRARTLISTVANGYKYQDVSDPLPGLRPTILAGVAAPTAADIGPRPSAELAGATDAPIPLGEGKSSARIAIGAPSRNILASDDRRENRLFLNVENITGSDPGGSYLVYVNVPEGEDPEDYPDHMIGTLPLFGIGAASRKDDKHGGGGLTIVLEMSELADQLEGEGEWNESEVNVDFVPLSGAPEESGVKIGRIGVYRA